MDKHSTIERATRVLAMVQVIQWEIDELARHKAFFRHELKMSGNNFLREINKQIHDLFKEFTPEAELFFYDQVECLEELLKAYAQNNVEVIEDKDK